jgi:L-asparagine transporter-like permease
MMTALSQIRLRQLRERAGEPAPAVSMWLFPWLSYLAVVAMLLILVAMYRSPEHWIELKWSLISFAVALAAYGIVRAVRNPRAQAILRSAPD